MAAHMDVEIPVENSSSNVFGSTESQSTGIDCTTLNIKQYIDRYEGFTKLKRLQFIMEKSRNLKIDAYILLMEECKKTVNVEAYVTNAALAKGILGSDFPIDQAWIDTTERKMALRLEKLTTESNAARSSMINESIRLSYSDMGYHYYEVGNLHEAQRLFMRMRDYCTTARHSADMAFSMVNVLLDLGIFTSIPSYITKSSTWADDPIATSKTKAVLGLYNLSEKKFKESALDFLTVGKSLESNYSSVISPEDVALYGVILGLTCLDRAEFKKNVESKAFRGYLDLVPGLKVFVSKYLTRQFGDCLPYLDIMLPEWKLDIYLSSCVDKLVTTIKENILVEYFAPYSALSLKKMAAGLNIPEDNLEAQLYKLIIAQKIDARIDDESRSLVQASNTSRMGALKNARQVGESHVTNLKAGLLRLSLIKNKLTLIGSEAINESVGRLDNQSKQAAQALLNFVERLPGFESDPRVLQIPPEDEYGMDDVEDND